jgi:hypothetical protein
MFPLLILSSSQTDSGVLDLFLLFAIAVVDLRQLGCELYRRSPKKLGNLSAGRSFASDKGFDLRQSRTAEPW